MWRALYNVLLTLAAPGVWLRLYLRGRRNPAYRERIPERRGHVPDAVPEGCIWFHTVSAGETIAAAPVIAAIAARFPNENVLVTTTTPTGSEQVLSRLGTAVHHCYAPYDFDRAVARFVARVAPRLLVLMETELWPNMLAHCARSGCRVMLVNARLSPRSARRYARIGGFTRQMLSALDYVAAQYPDHAARFEALGLSPSRLEVLGSVKFDVRLPDDTARRVETLELAFGLRDRPVWIAASTHEGEDDAVLEAHREISSSHRGAVLVLVPRHPERADTVCRLAAAHGFRIARRSAGRGEAGTQVIVGDTMGELLYLYGLASAAFIGGSLVARGGHNPIEAAAHGIALVTGPHVFNFADVVSRFRDADAIDEVGDAAALAGRVTALLGDGAECARRGARAAAVVAANRGATAAVTERIAGAIEDRRAGTVSLSIGGKAVP